MSYELNRENLVQSHVSLMNFAQTYKCNIIGQAHEILAHYHIGQ